MINKILFQIYYKLFIPNIFNKEFTKKEFTIKNLQKKNLQKNEFTKKLPYSVGIAPPHSISLLNIINFSKNI